VAVRVPQLRTTAADGAAVKPNTEEGEYLLQVQRVVFQRLAELDKTAPADVELVLRAMVGHLRAWKPLTLLAAPEVSEGP